MGSLSQRVVCETILHLHAFSYSTLHLFKKKLYFLRGNIGFGLHCVTRLLSQRKTWQSELANSSRHPTRALEKVIILCHWGRCLFLWRFLLSLRIGVLKGSVFLAAVIYVLWALSLNHASKRDGLFYRETCKVIYAAGVTCFKAVH